MQKLNIKDIIYMYDIIREYKIFYFKKEIFSVSLAEVHPNWLSDSVMISKPN